MKKLKIVLTSALILFLLAACSEPADQEPVASNVENEEIELEEETTEAVADVGDEKNIEDILQQSIDTMNSVENFSMQMDMVQDMNMPGEGSYEVKMTIQSDIILEPMTMYQNMTMVMDEAGIGEMTTESYFTEDGMYIKDEYTENWTKIPMEYSADMLGAMDMQVDSTEQLELLKQFGTNLSLSEDNGSYIISVNGEGADIKELASQAMAMFDTGAGQLDELFDTMEISTFEYEIHIDKETSFQTKVVSYIEMSMTVEGETLTIKQSMEGSITNINGVGDISVPAEVLENAIDLDFEGLGDFDLGELEDIELELE
ncbi:DUF6612 family protein [Bacillus alkalicellulosilyticus]|uniref:DUF6612 family protein n=1 Tax=Alkalihalobacterium alkalicellulosilyticum TaxID=1912214 RepID=UPI000996FFA9|nr:DUF6612 family protein [Bacillus alkalicellulosilyticus]